MTWPNIPYAAQVQPTMDELDATFAAIGNNVVIPCGTSTGNSNITLTPTTSPATPAVTSYVAYTCFSFIAGNGNLGAASVNINSLGALKLFRSTNALKQVSNAGEIVAGNAYVIMYNPALDTGSGGFQIVSGGVGVSKLVQRVVATTSAFISGSVSGIAVGAAMTAADGVQALVTTITPVASGNNILARAITYAANNSAAGTLQSIIAQGSTVVGGMVFQTGNAANVSPMPIETNVALTGISTLSFQTRVTAVANTPSTVGINGSTSKFGGGNMASILVLEEWTTGT